MTTKEFKLGSEIHNGHYRYIGQVKHLIIGVGFRGRFGVFNIDGTVKLSPGDFNTYEEAEKAAEKYQVVKREKIDIPVSVMSTENGFIEIVDGTLIGIDASSGDLRIKREDDGSMHKWSPGYNRVSGPQRLVPTLTHVTLLQETRKLVNEHRKLIEKAQEIYQRVDQVF